MFLCLTLLGYALFGKGWAYIGVPPVFIGEVALFFGLVSFLRFGTWRGFLDVPAVTFLLLLVAWGSLRTLPYLSQYGAQALRDAVIWGYSAFAMVVFGIILARPARLAFLLQRYRQFSLIFLVVVPVLWTFIRILGRPAIPRWPWADVPVIDTKGGDTMVHAGGILAFWVVGLGAPVGIFRVLLLAFCVVLAGIFDRSGLLSFLAVFAACLFLYPRDRSCWRLAGIGACGLVLLAVTNVRVPMVDREERELSFAQLVANLSSLVTHSRTGDLDDTKQWRLAWWGDIVNYTVHGKYFWTGKGFGINLADDDDYQVDETGALRSPHNGHMTILARAGVPGLVLWIMVQLSWACGVLGSYVRGRRLGEGHWASLFLFLLLYWMAFMINSTFDVFLEGPHGGIWFWTIYGVGMAAMWLYKHNPEVLSDSAVKGMLAPDVRDCR
jgi:hypothetical protein